MYQQYPNNYQQPAAAAAAATAWPAVNAYDQQQQYSQAGVQYQQPAQVKKIKVDITCRGVYLSKVLALILQTKNHPTCDVR